MREVERAVQAMAGRIAEILEDRAPSIYIYGSLALHDFRPGWSDIDILALTQKKLTEGQARQLVRLRQVMLGGEPRNPYYRSFEGGVLSLRAFRSGEKDRAVY